MHRFCILAFIDSWDTYYRDITNAITKTTEVRIVVDNEKLHVLDSSFISLHYAGKGGALFCETTTDKTLLVEETVFTSCSTDDHGGGIWFNNQGQSVIARVCAFDCHTTQQCGDQFYNIQVSPDYRKKNMLTYSTVYSSEENRYYGATICPKEGTITLSHTNQSRTHCKCDTIFFGHPTANAQETTGFLSYSSFSNNTASEARCFSFIYYNKYYLIDHCNIIHSTQESQNFGIITTYCYLKFYECCLLGNGDSKFVTGAGARVDLEACAVDFDINAKILISHTIVSEAQTSFVNPVIGINTQKCQASYDSVGEITPIIIFSREWRRRRQWQYIIWQSRRSIFL